CSSPSTDPPSIGLHCAWQSPTPAARPVSTTPRSPWAARVPRRHFRSPPHPPIDVGARTAEATLPIPAPLLWDTEHPNLYRLEATILADELYGGSSLFSPCATPASRKHRHI